jgi:hypothetical protein
MRSLPVFRFALALFLSCRCLAADVIMMDDFELKADTLSEVSPKQGDWKWVLSANEDCRISSSGTVATIFTHRTGETANKDTSAKLSYPFDLENNTVYTWEVDFQYTQPVSGGWMAIGFGTASDLDPRLNIECPWILVYTPRDTLEREIIGQCFFGPASSDNGFNGTTDSKFALHGQAYDRPIKMTVKLDTKDWKASFYINGMQVGETAVSGADPRFVFLQGFNTGDAVEIHRVELNAEKSP